MRSGWISAGLAAAAVGAAFAALVAALPPALTGAFLLPAAPAIGLCVSVGVALALRRVCATGSGRADAAATAGIAFLFVLAVFGVSLGGLVLLVPGAILALAAALAPRPAAGRSC